MNDSTITERIAKLENRISDRPNLSINEQIAKLKQQICIAKARGMKALADKLKADLAAITA